MKKHNPVRIHCTTHDKYARLGDDRICPWCGKRVEIIEVEDVLDAVYGVKKEAEE